MKTRNPLRRAALGAIALLGLATCVVGCGDARAADDETTITESDQEMARLLVKLELRTRAVIAGHLGRQQAGGEEDTAAYKQFLIDNLILPAAVADAVYHETVADATGGRAWVKMIVDAPRNPNNEGDATTAEMLAEIKGGAASAERVVDGAYYYAEPIRTTAGCLACHGEPAGEPDPHFPEYVKDGWKEGEVIGAVTARVAP